MSSEAWHRRHRELQALVDKFAEECEAAGEPFPEIRQLVGAIAEYHPVLREMPDSEDKLVRAYELAMRTLPSEADSRSMLAEALNRRKR
jgi:hypothetical protein